MQEIYINLDNFQRNFASVVFPLKLQNSKETHMYLYKVIFII